LAEQATSIRNKDNASPWPFQPAILFRRQREKFKEFPAVILFFP
jgi:hypothetical protein